MRSRAVVAGAVVVVVYLVAVAVTAAVRPGGARPLFDGFTAPASYRFVEPPSFFAAGNVVPRPLSTSIALGPRGSAAAGFATPDGQFVVSLAEGAIAPAAGATAVSVRVTPVAPRRLTPVPDGLRANGNAYRVEMNYVPTGGAVTRIGEPGSLLIEIPELGTALFTSPDSAAWTHVAARPIPPRQLSMTALFGAPGYYLAATSLPELASAPGGSHRGAIVLGVVTAAATLALFGVAYLVARRRRAAAVSARSDETDPNSWEDRAMTHFKVGDKVIITEGDFKGERGAITDKHVIGDGLTVALEKHGKEIKTHEAHVNKVDD